MKLKIPDSAASLRKPCSSQDIPASQSKQLGHATPQDNGLVFLPRRCCTPCHQQITALTGLVLKQHTLNCSLLFTPEFIVGSLAAGAGGGNNRALLCGERKRRTRRRACGKTCQRQPGVLLPLGGSPGAGVPLSIAPWCWGSAQEMGSEAWVCHQQARQ